MNEFYKEQSLIIIKHDGVLRNLIGEVIRRFENVCLHVVALKMMWADDTLAGNHYKLTEEWATSLFERTKTSKEKIGEKFAYTDPLVYGALIQSWNKKFLMEGPVVAIVFEGPHAVELGRKLVGHTEPRQALPGTIRGDYTYESYTISDAKKRPIRNLVHASGSVEEARREINLWFSKKEIHTYKY